MLSLNPRNFSQIIFGFFCTVMIPSAFSELWGFFFKTLVNYTFIESKKSIGSISHNQLSNYYVFFL